MQKFSIASVGILLKKFQFFSFLVMPLMTENFSALARDTSTTVRSPKANESGYFSTEFVYNLLPCYFFLGAAIVRFLKIKDLPSLKEKLKVIEMNENDEENTVRQKFEEEENEDADESNSKAASFYIKRRLSLLMCFTYLISIPLAIVLPVKWFWAAHYPIGSLMFLFGALAWFISALLLEIEFKKGLNQSLWSHRIFWPFACSLAFIRVFQGTEISTISLIMNATRFLGSGVLLLYAIYKPYDRELSLGEYDDEIPSIVRNIFDKIENSKIWAKIFGFSHVLPGGASEIPMMNVKAGEADDNLEEYKQYLRDKRASSVAGGGAEQEKFLAKMLPKRRAVAINKKLIKKMVNTNEIRYYYQIITQIEQSDFPSERRYPEFLELERDLHRIYNMHDFPTLYEKLPRLESVEIDQHHEEQLFIQNRIKSLEKYLQELLKNPVFMHPKLLDFLQIEQEQRTPFLAYFTYLSKSAQRKKRRVSKLIANDENEVKMEKPIKKDPASGPADEKETKNEKPGTGYQPPTLIQGENMASRNQKKHNFYFDIACEGWQKAVYGNHYEYIFLINNLSKFPKQSWKIIKNYVAVRDFNELLENRLGKTIPFFNKYVPKATGNSTAQNDRTFLNSRKEGLEKYMKAIITNKEYYCDTFFEFIKYDAEKEIVIDSRYGTPRNSAKVEEVVKISDDLGANEVLHDFETETSLPVNSLGAPLYDFLDKKTPNDPAKVHLVHTINFDRVAIRVYKILEKKSPKEGEPAVVYYLTLEEYYISKKLKTVIKLMKNYEEIKKLHTVIMRVYRGLDIHLPQLPSEKGAFGTRFNPRERKTEFEVYFWSVLRLPRIEENELFEDFFSLHKIQSSVFKNLRDETEVLDFTDISK